jgi:hypothetical protein
MLKQLRGRNLAHVGCTLGLVLGLGDGIMLAWVLILHSVPAAFALALWLLLTLVLGVTGFIIGNVTTGHKAGE